MKNDLSKIEKYRVKDGPFTSKESDGPNGHFIIPSKYSRLFVIASNGGGWEHVSAHAMKDGKQRIPTWDDMCLLKSLFWEKDEVVIQYHPPEKQYINVHKYVLHLWKPIGIVIPTPPLIMV
jgi:hypothetical protein